MDDLKTVLLVDDQIAIQEILANLLRNNLYKVDVCQNGKEAEDRLSDHAYDLVITDLIMPNGDGYDLLDFINKRSQQQGESQRIMVITGENSLDVPQLIQDRAAIECFTLYKPFTKQDFLDSVNLVFESTA